MKVLICGAEGQLGQALQTVLASRNIECIALSHQGLDVTAADAVDALLSVCGADFVINSTGFRSADKAESNAQKCRLLNVEGSVNLAKTCSKLNIPLMQFSSTDVYDGKKASAYIETDALDPINFIGLSQLEAEQKIAEICPKHIILRLGWLFSETGENFFTQVLELALKQPDLSFATDLIGNPTYTLDAARVIVAMLEQLHCKTTDDLWGVYQYGGSDACSKHKFATAIINGAKQFDNVLTESIAEIESSELPNIAHQPKNNELNCKKLTYQFGIKQLPWRRGMKQALKARYEPVE